MNKSPNIVELRNITKKYQVADHQQVVFNELSYAFTAGVNLAILGSSGCGKTTLLNIIGGIDSDFTGELLFKGQAISNFDQYRREHVSFIFQDLNLIAHYNLVKNITIGLTNDVVDKEQKALQLLERVGLKAHADKLPHQLSGGERQRVAVARALARDTDLLLCDEPTGSLDAETKAEIMQLIVDVFQDKTIIFITHDEAIAQRFSDIILTITDKKLSVVSGSNDTAATLATAESTTQQADKTFNKRFEINLLSKKLNLFNAAYLIIVISAIFLFGTGLVRGIEHKIDDYLYDKYKVDKLDVLTSDYTLNGFSEFADDYNKQNNHQIVGYMTGAWLKTTFLDSNEEHYLFANMMQPAIKDRFEPDIVYGRFPQKSNEVLYSKGAAQQMLYTYYSLALDSAAARNTLFERLSGISDEALFNELTALDISYKNLRQYDDNKAYDNDLVIVGLIDDISYSTRAFPLGGNSPQMRQYNINSNTELSIEYQGQVKQITVNDNIYMLETEFRNYVNAVYVGNNGLKFKAFSVFIANRDLDLRKTVYDGLLLYKHMFSGDDPITDERAVYYDEVHGYKVAIVGGCLLLYIFAVIAIYNGIKTSIDRNKINIGIYKSLGYTSHNIKAMFFKEGLLMAVFIISATLVTWFVLTIVLSDYMIYVLDLSSVISLGHIIYLDSYALLGVIASLLIIILGSIARELSKINIINLIKNR